VREGLLVKEEERGEGVREGLRLNDQEAVVSWKEGLLVNDVDGWGETDGVTWTACGGETTGGFFPGVMSSTRADRPNKQQMRLSTDSNLCLGLRGTFLVGL